jgi:hypothetical protein
MNERLMISIYLQTYQTPVKRLFKYMLDVATGMHYISEKGLIHRVRIKISHRACA